MRAYVCGSVLLCNFFFLFLIFPDEGQKKSLGIDNTRYENEEDQEEEEADSTLPTARISGLQN